VKYFMLKFLVKLLLFFFLILTLFSWASSVFTKGDINSFKGRELNESNNIELAFFGSSRALCTYDPRVFENGLGKRAYNYGFGSQRLFTGMPMMESRLSNEVKLGVVDIFSASVPELSFEENVNNFQYNTIDNTENSLQKLLTFVQIYGFENIFEIFPVVRNHALWDELLLKPEYVLKENIDYYKGFRSELSFNKTRWNRSSDGNKRKLHHRIQENHKLTDG